MASGGLFATDGGALKNSSSGLDTSDEAIKESWKKVRDEKLDWLILHVEGKAKLVFGAEGTGKDAFLAALNDDTVAFGGFRFNNKFMRFHLVGDNVPGMKRGAVAMHKNAIFKLLEGPALELSGDSKEDFEENLEKALLT